MVECQIRKQINFSMSTDAINTDIVTISIRAQRKTLILFDLMMIVTSTESSLTKGVQELDV